MNLRTASLSLLVAACLPLAATAAPLKPPPKALDTLESHAEDAIDHAANREWSRVHQDVRATVSAWRALRPDLVRAKLPASTLQAMDQRVAAFQRLDRASAMSPLKLQEQANAVTALVPDLQARYQTKVPAVVSRMDYLGRQVQLDNQAKDPQQARAHAKDLRAAWQGLRTRAEQVAPGAIRAIDRDVASITRQPTSQAASLAAKNLLDRVDDLEKGFLTANAKSAGGGAGAVRRRGSKP